MMTTAERIDKLAKKPVNTMASNVFTLTVALSLVLAGSLYFLIPGALAAAAVGVLNESWSPFWATGLMAGGLLAAIGIIGMEPRAEVGGLTILSASMSFASIAVVDVREQALWPSALIFGSIAIAGLARMVTVYLQERNRHALAAAVAEYDRELRRTSPVTRR